LALLCHRRTPPLFPYTTLFRSQAEDIGADLRHWFGDHPETWPPVVRCRIGDEDLSIAAVPLGFHGKLGIIVTGAQRVDFPEQKRSEEHTSELQSRFDLVCRLLL